MPDVVVTRDLRKSFGKLDALKGLDFRVGQGEVYGLIGPNGSGKTTTIRILCGLLRADGGEGTVFGVPAGSQDVRSMIGYMPQELAVYPDLKVKQNLDFFGRLNGLGGERLATREKALLRLVALDGRGDSLVSTLSGGMKHRLSLACSLIHNPKLLFLDEPTVGVDPELRFAFWQYLGRLKEGGVTALITTHYMDEAGRCDRVGLIREGRLIAEGTPHELRTSAGTDSLEDAFLVFSRRESR